MTVTYRHDAQDPDNNPTAPSFDVLARVSTAIEMAALKQGGPLTRTPDIMGFKLSPSPELHGAKCAVLEVDYEDGQTLTFDVDFDGSIEQRKYAYASALIFETGVPLNEDQIETALAFIGQAFMNCEAFQASVEFASTPRRTRYRPNDDYAVQPTDEHTGVTVP